MFDMDGVNALVDKVALLYCPDTGLFQTNLRVSAQPKALSATCEGVPQVPILSATALDPEVQALGLVVGVAPGFSKRPD